MFEAIPIGKKEAVGIKDVGFTPITISTPPPVKTAPKFEEIPFAGKHPNLYAAGRVAVDMVPYAKYLDPEERGEFMKLNKQEQVRDLLLQNLEAVVEVGTKPLAAGAKAIIYAKSAGSKFIKSRMPKTYAKIMASFDDVAKVPTPDIAPKAKEPLPKYAGSVNLERQAISDEAKRLELEMFDLHGVKSSVSHESMIKKAESIIDDFNTNPESYAKRVDAIKAGATPTIEEELAHRMINAREYDEFVNVIKSGDPAAIEAMEQSIKTKHLEVTDPLAAQAGRRLSSYNIVVGKQRAMKAVAKLGKKLNPRQLKELGALDTTDPEAVKRFVKRLPDPKLRDYFYEFWYNSILSGVPTHVVNVASNTLWMATQLPHRMLVGSVDKVISGFTGRARARYVNEVIPMMAGMGKGAKQGAKGAWEMLRHGKVEQFETKWAQEIGSSLGAFDRSPSKVVRGIGKLITPPTKALRGMDVLANSIGYESQLRALARRAANQKGLKGGKYAEARKAFEMNFIKNPSEQAHKEAMEFGKYVTFMSDPGWVSSMIISGRNKMPLESGRLIVPFVNTIGNLLKRGVEMTPGLGLALVRGQHPSEIVAKQIEGLIVGAYAWNKFDMGEITGAAPIDKAEREAFYRQGKKAWSLRFGDEWVQYRRVEPFNTIIASVAIARDRVRNAKDDETKTEIMLGMANDLKNNLIDSGYLQGVTQILNRHGKAKGAVQRLGASLVPYSGFLRSIGKSYEALTEGEAKVRESNTWAGALSQTIPFVEKPPAKLSIWGEEIVFEGGMFRQWLPYKWSTQTTDKTELALEKLGVYPGMPSQTVTIRGEKKRLDDGMYRDMVIFFGGRAKKKLDVMFSNKVFQKALKDESNHPKLIKVVNRQLTYERDLARRKAIREIGKVERSDKRIVQEVPEISEIVPPKKTVGFTPIEIAPVEKQPEVAKPKQIPMGKYNTELDVSKAFKKGDISEADAEYILKTKFGFEE